MKRLAERLASAEGRGMSMHVAWMARDFGRRDLSLLSPSDIAVLSRMLEPLSVSAGQRILSPGQEADAAYIVERGEVELLVRRGARRAVISIQGPGGVFGDVPMLCGSPFPFTAIARSDAVLLRLKAERLTDLLGRHPAIALRWLASVVRRLERANRRVVELTVGNLRARILALLADEVGQGREPRLRMSQAEVASLLGARRQSVNRVLRQLTHEGLVRQGYGAIEVVDHKRLIELAGGTRAAAC